MKIYLETERMKLLEFEKNDRELIRSLDSDPEVMKYISNGNPSSEEEVDRAMGIFLAYNKRYEYELGYWKAICKETGVFLGWFHFRPLKSNLDDLSNIELGYRLGKKVWGKGYATEGSSALINKARKDLEIKKVWAHAMLGNTPSINVMKKVGLLHDHDDIYEQWPGEDKRTTWYSLELNH
jgi:RimJ/RimL family protein N-acetyltransferase